MVADSAGSAAGRHLGDVAQRHPSLPDPAGTGDPAEADRSDRHWFWPWPDFAVGRDTRPATVFVVDTSDSMLLAERANAHGIIDAFVQAFGADAPVGAVQFGASTAVLAAPQRLEEAPPLRSDLPGHDSNYEAGILTALGLLDPRRGRATGADFRRRGRWTGIRVGCSDGCRAGRADIGHPGRGHSRRRSCGPGS